MNKLKFIYKHERIKLKVFLPKTLLSQDLSILKPAAILQLLLIFSNP